MSRALTIGDPSSVSRLAVDALNAGRALEQRAEHLDALVTSYRPVRTTRSERDLIARARDLAASARASADELSRIGLHLQSQASDLGQLRAALSHLHEEIAACGLVLDGSRILHPWGITGVATRADDRRREDDRVRLQDELDALSRVAARRRSSLSAELTASQARWLDLAKTLAR